MTAREIEVAVAKYFDYRANLIVPNVSWGLLDHEADLLMLSRAGYATEIEIKISRADLRRDQGKHHHHESDLVKAFWFAVPAALREFALTAIPEEAGLLEIRERVAGDAVYRRAYKVRDPKPRPHSRRFTDAEREQLARLAAMRYWDRRADPIEAVWARIAI